MTLNNLAALCRSQRRHTDAEPLFLRALSIFKTALDAHHPKVGTCLTNYARLLREMGRETEALALETRARRSWPSTSVRP